MRIFMLFSLLMLVNSAYSQTLGKRKKPVSTTTTSGPVQDRNKVSAVSVIQPPAPAISDPIQRKVKLPFLNTEQDYWVTKEGHYYILNGDIIVGSDFPKTMSYSIKSDYLWSNASVPVVIDPSIEKNNLTDVVLQAIGVFNSQTNICITPRKDEPNFIRIVSSTTISGAGQSPIGRQDGQQDLLLKPGSANRTTVIHELMHAIGMYHEQSRDDRDSYVTIKPEHIKPGLMYNFQIESGNARGTYDYCSIMHYDSTAFSADGKATIQCPDGPKGDLCRSCNGKRNNLTPQDIQGIFSLYSSFLRPPCNTVFPAPNRGMWFSSTVLPESEKAMQSFRHRADYASANGFAAGFPNFHEAARGNDIVGGTILIKHGMVDWQDVPLAFLGGVTLQDFAGRMRATQDYAVARGYVGGFPNYHSADYGPGTVCGTFLLPPSSAEFRDVPLSELGNPNLNDIGARMRSANDYAFRNGFLGGFPTFYSTDYGKGTVCGIILIKKEAGEWRDVVIASGPR